MLLLMEPTALEPMTTAAPAHEPVMTAEVLAYLAPRPGQTIVDATVGLGGHSAQILPRLGPQGRLIAVDCDAQALEVSRQRLSRWAGQMTFVHDRFQQLPDILARCGVTAVDGILLDVGISSMQLDAPERGFTFAYEAPLDMRMDPESDVTAQDLINYLSERELAQVFWAYGEERYSRAIARAIARQRRGAPLRTTTQLAALVEHTVPRGRWPRHIHPATRVFQALRIAVNHELDALRTVLPSAMAHLTPGGRLVIVTFHSLEDRLVKHAFRQAAREGEVTVLTKKPVVPGAEERQRNPRARSAKLRVVEKLAVNG